MTETNSRLTVDQQAVLERLSYSMTASQREELLLMALKILNHKCNFGNHSTRCETKDIKKRLNDHELDDWMISIWPGDWPGQEFVDLNYVGDPGAWLRNVFGEPISQVLFGCAWDDEANAAWITNDYLREIREQGYSLPSDFGDSPGEKGWKDCSDWPGSPLDEYLCLPRRAILPSRKWYDVLCRKAKGRREHNAGWYCQLNGMRPK